MRALKRVRCENLPDDVPRRVTISINEPQREGTKDLGEKDKEAKGSR